MYSRNSRRSNEERVIVKYVLMKGKYNLETYLPKYPISKSSRSIRDSFQNLPHLEELNGSQFGKVQSIG
jgi:hypothetical protein